MDAWVAAAGDMAADGRAGLAVSCRTPGARVPRPGFPAHMVTPSRRQGGRKEQLRG